MLFSWCGIIGLLVTALSAMAPTVTGAQPTTVHAIKKTVITGRVLDIADSVALFEVVVQIEPFGTGVARTDSAGLFLLSVKSRPRSMRLLFTNGFYESDSIVTQVLTGDTVDIGIMLLKRGKPPLEYAVIPWCEQVTRVPKPIPDGMWVQHDSRSRKKSTLMLCDGLLRESRVSTTPPHSR